MPNPAHNAVEGDLLPGIKKMIKAKGKLRAITQKGFARQISSATNFSIIIGEAPSRNTNAEVGVLAQRPADPQLRIQISGRQRQSQREVGLKKIRFIVIIES